MGNTTNNIITNRKVFYQYNLLQKYEGGISLKGSEVKAIRENKANIKESYIHIKNDELYIIGMNIGQYSHKGYSPHDSMREKKILVHKYEIKKNKS